MTPAEAAALQGLAAAYDNRKPSEMVAREWSLAMPEIALADAMEAVRGHYRASTDYLTVAHIRAGVKRLRAKRLEDSPVVEPPAVDPDNTAAYLAAIRRRNAVIASGAQPQARAAIGTARDMEYGRVFKSA